jgi:general secretion pathway protein G
MFSRLTNIQRGDSVSGVKTTGRRALVSADARGFSLIELMITVTIMTILTMGVIPLVKVSIKRQKEQQLRETLRQIRTAIDEFHRDTIGMTCTGGGLQPGTGGTGTQPQPNTGQVAPDPRSKVMISDCTIFGVDNLDHYPPDLDTLVNGVNVIPRVQANMGGKGLGTSDNKTTLDSQSSTM